MATITPANISVKDSNNDLGHVLSLTDADITLLNDALQAIEDLKLAVQNPSPTGMVALWDNDNIPDGWLLCNGAAVSRTTYAALFAKLGTRHGAGDGSSTFNLPDMRDRYPIGAGTNVLGTMLAEQLPNITGSLSVRGNAGNLGLKHLGSGCIVTYAYVETGCMDFYGSTTNGNVESNFVASRSSVAYTDNGKVYPLSLALNYIIKS